LSPKHAAALSEISAYVDKQRRAQTRRNAALQPNGPTPERAAKAGEGGISTQVVVPSQGPQQAVKNHTFTAPLEKYRAHIPNELEAAARQLLHDFLLAEAGPRVTANYTGVGGAASKHHGGVADRVREAQATVSLIRAEWHQEFIQDVEWFILQVVTKGDGSAMRFEDAGARINPPWRSLDALKGIGYGGFYRTLCLAARWYARQRARHPDKHQVTAEDTRRLAQELRARAQQYRERKALR